MSRDKPTPEAESPVADEADLTPSSPASSPDALAFSSQERERDPVSEGFTPLSSGGGYPQPETSTMTEEEYRALYTIDKDAAIRARLAGRVRPSKAELERSKLEQRAYEKWRKTYSEGGESH